MAKNQVLTHICSSCQKAYHQWKGQCNQCSAWGTIQEQVVQKQNSSHYANSNVAVKRIKDVANVSDVGRTISTTLAELDRVLGNGMVSGSVILLGGDPGIGKSTLMLQLTGYLHAEHEILYVSGEESMGQIALRAKRLGLSDTGILLSTQTVVERILDQARKAKIDFLIIDSIQSMESLESNSLPGSTNQLREVTLQLIRYAKQSNVVIWIIGHVTKEGQIAGPKVLEHMVDVVMYFEGEPQGRYRMIRAIKNRFGPVNELGIFVMTEHKMLPVNNPSTIFLQGIQKNTLGNTVAILAQGSRFLLIEVQTLVDTKSSSNKRICLGADASRLNMIIAILSKYANMSFGQYDIFLNVVGGIKITETALDVCMVLALYSSFKNTALPPKLAAFGEMGLSGEVRPVLNGHQRIKEAAKHGFSDIILPKSNAPTQPINGTTLHPVEDVAGLLQVVDQLLAL